MCDGKPGHIQDVLHDDPTASWFVVALDDGSDTCVTA